MPDDRPYPGENPVAAKARIAKNKAKGNVKTKSDMMADNVANTLKNMGGGY